MRWLLALVLLTQLSFSAWGQSPIKKLPQRPKLFIVLVIDQFRADYLTRFESRLLPAQSKSGLGGFKLLTTKGAFFPVGEYDMLQAMTCPGHAMIMSGAHPYLNGIVLNEWYDKEKRKTVYCADDDVNGSSATNLRSTTVPDELKLAGYKSRTVGIALKDRSAIMLTGHSADHVFWLDSKNHQWITSKKYSPDKSLPDWVTKQNEQLKKAVGTEYVWKSAGPATGLSETSEKNFVRKYKIGERDALSSPYGVEVTFNLAYEAIKNLKLGRGPHTDVLAISLSSHDALGHQLGPNSLEMEEMTIFEDRAISKFLNFLKAQGLLNNVALVLTADHGVAPTVDFARKTGLQAGRINYLDVFKKLNTHLDKKFGRPKNNQWFAAFMSLNFYFDRETLAEKKVNLAEAEAEAKKILEQEPGVFHVLTSTEYRNGKLPSGFLGDYVKNQYSLNQSGDLVIIPRPYYMDGDENRKGTTHMTGYGYDRTVPIVFWGKGIRAGVHPYQVRVVDIAPTVSFHLGVLPPSMSHGKILQIFE